MKKLLAQILMVTTLVLPIAAGLPMQAGAVGPNWDTSGDYVIAMNYLGTDYAHDMHLVQDSSGNLTGHGGSPAGANTYMWTITSGNVSADAITFTANYTATPDAVTPQTVLHVTGAIASDGSMSGTWSDNYQGGERAGTWHTTSGMAHQIETETVKVTIVKYIDGQMANSTSANNKTFTMNANWNAQNTGAGSGQYTLGPNTNPPYQAMTSALSKGGSYSTSEVMDSSVGKNCKQDTPYKLKGYQVGNTLQEAQQAPTTHDAPSFTNLQSDKFVIVKNKTCKHDGDGDDNDDDTVHVTIVKFVDGQMATANSANNATFTMNSNWNAQNTGAGSGQFTLSPNGNTPYQAVTSELNKGASYSTSEVDDATVDSSCTTNGAPFKVVGYQVGNTLNQAQQAPVSQTAPSFTNLQSDRFVIVRNEKCNPNNTDNGQLHVDSISMVKTSGTADGTFASGWKYVFHITDPNNEPKMQFKFSDWTMTSTTSGTGIIPVANNMRISSNQADNGGATILLTAANTYSTPPLNMVTDLNSSMVGRQVDVTVEVALPTGTTPGSYTTNYGIQSNP